MLRSLLNLQPELMSAASHRVVQAAFVVWVFSAAESSTPLLKRKGLHGCAELLRFAENNTDHPSEMHPIRLDNLHVQSTFLGTIPKTLNPNTKPNPKTLTAPIIEKVS